MTNNDFMQTNELNKKVLFAGLDGTLIDTISGSAFPKGIWDMQFKWDVIDAIKNYGFKCLIIVTNQGGIEKGFVDEKHFVQGKMNYITMALEEYLGIPVEYDYCRSNDKNDYFRKSNTGMLEQACFKILPKHNIIANSNETLMIGDASGKSGQFSDSDKKAAENFGIDYMDINDFVQFNNKIMKTNELSCKDLMVGDWMRIKVTKRDTKVTNIATNNVYTEAVFPIRYDEIEPIPLTPEILENNGFHEEWDEDIKLMVCDSIIVEIGNNYKLYTDGKMYLYRVSAPLYYVHQLQHALRLCNIEKEIIL